MNQILQVNEETKYKSKSGNAKEIVLYLIVVSILFGLIFGAYLIFKNITKEDPKPTNEVNNIKVPEYIPNIILEKTSGNKLIINVECETGISKLTYNWNNENSQIVELNGTSNIEKIIDMPFGENTIYVSVTDVNGKETQKEETFIIELPKPQIELSVVGSSIKISVTSEIELAKITYTWNSETIKEENMTTYEDRNNFEKKIEIPVGNNTLTVVAVDINGGQSEKVQEIKGVTKATTKTEVKNGYWHFTVTGKENIKLVEFEFNGNKYIMNTSTFGQTKVVHYKVKLVNGTNYLKITSTTESDGVDTTEWNKEYTEE